jgi:hemerythrin-like domain-containing protein
MKVTKGLLGEHAVFGALFDHLERTVPAASTAAQVRDLGAMLASALSTHAGIEDELLFDALGAVMDAQLGPVAVMRMEHEQIEGGLQQLPSIDDVDMARRVLLQVVETARGHFAKEEQVLFPIAEQMLGESRLLDLGRRWSERRRVVETDVPACA